jgi:membrane protease YdiL (CAAX protease family)
MGAPKVLSLTPELRIPSPWDKLPLSFRAILLGLLVTLPAANVWPLLLVSLGVPLATAAEAVFLGFFLWWTSGGGPPRSTQTARATAFRRVRLSPRQWLWGTVAALSFAATIHAAILLLFRFVPFPMMAFRQGYDLSYIRSLPLKWVAVVVSAASAGICEETGFRGYMQRTIEQRHSVVSAIVTSSVFFTALHLTKGWATAGMVPIVFGAGILLGLLAWSAGSLIPCIIGHVAMDIGLFGYWWSGVAGDFTARPVTETGVDRPFVLAWIALAVSLSVVLFAISQTRERHPPDANGTTA